MQEAKERPYFIWNADLTEDDVRQILAGDSGYSRVQMMSTIPHYARFNDIWQYLSVRDVQKWFWQIPWRDAELRDYWKWALTLWGHSPDECADPVAARLSVCAETLRLRGKSQEAEAMLEDVRRRFPRHRAFKSELDVAVQRMGTA